MMRKILWVSVCALSAAAVAAAEVPREARARFPAERVIQVETLRATQTIDREAVRRDIERVHAWLMTEQVTAGVERPLSVSVSAEALAALEADACESCTENPGALRVGLVAPLAVKLTLAEESFGALAPTPEGGRVWSAAVRSEGAYGLRLHFANFELPADTELYLFNLAGQVIGPYTGAGPRGSGEFWSHTVWGDTAFLQLRVYGPASAEKIGRTSFDLVDVGHVATRPGAARRPFGAKSFCSYNEECIANAECHNVTVVDDARDAVAHMQYVKRPYLYVCSGGLLNTSANDRTPYFLTANHCISRDREASTLETFFQWTTPCNGECPEQWSEPVGVPSMLGASVVKTNRTGDYTLLLLDGVAPAGLAFLGWTTSPVAYNDNAMLYRISHPSAAPQAYSSHDVDPSAGTCSSWPRGSWIYSRDVVGATEGGSSGSPVVNAQGLVVGQLSGGCGTNVYDTCDSVSNATVDGAFASYFGEIAQWLDPGDCPDGDNDGFTDAACGGADCDDSDPAINPLATEICDGVDNNCDGTIDEGCGGECLPAGDPCSSGADCCSGLCHPKKLVCK